jgi:hypothetical protein
LLNAILGNDIANAASFQRSRLAFFGTIVC